MPKGYAGRILHVDLTRGNLWSEEPHDVYYRTYFGGPGIGLYYLLKEMGLGVDALSPDNVLVFAAGTLAGTPGPAVGGFTVCAKSPLTGTAGKSESGGWWGAELKMAGWDAVVVRGRSHEPVYLWIDGDRAEIRDASRLWGKTTAEVQRLIQQELGSQRIRVAQIGPAGEKLVRFANVTNELTHFNGRNGLGAVMGSKRLRAIAVRGEGRVEVHDSHAMSATTRWVARNLKDHPEAWRLHHDGTPTWVVNLSLAGALPTNNWNSGVFSRAADISGAALTGNILGDRKGCFSCPIRCKRAVKVDGGHLHVDPEYGGPEYETVVALGSNCGIGNVELLAKANETCNSLGIDTTSMGATISFAMDCFENGIITERDTGGLKLAFGNEEVLLPLIEMVARRRGFGALLSEGSLRASAALGMGSERFLRQTKGQEVPFHDPRVEAGLGLQYALSGYGADHWLSQHDPLYAEAGSSSLQELAPLGPSEPVSALELTSKSVAAFHRTQMLTSAYDMLGVCIFGTVARSILPVDRLVDLLNAATGWSLGLSEIMKAGERTTNMARMFNVREGFGKKDDVLPELFYEPFKAGPLAGKGAIDAAEFANALDMYYRMAGWDTPDGRPSRAKLAELGLDWVRGTTAGELVAWSRKAPARSRSG